MRSTTHFQRFSVSVFQRFSLCLLSLFLLAPAQLLAATRTWSNTNGATATWNRSTNWLLAAIPGANDTAIINNSGTAYITSASGTYNVLNLGTTSGSSGNVNISGGTLAGTNFSPQANIGKVAGASGTVTMTAGTWNAGTIAVGLSGTGTINLSGGALNSLGGTGLGINAGSVGTATVSGGTWATDNDLVVGSNGTGTLTLSGSGVVTLNTSGAKILIADQAGSVGTLNLGTGTSAGTVNTSNIQGGSGSGTVNFNQSGSYTLAPSLTGNMTVNAIGTGTTILTGTNTYSGTTNITAGTLQIGNSGTTGTLGNGKVVNSASLVFSRSDSLTVSNTISGTGSLSQAGGGALILSASNSYSGGTLISSGTLEVSHSSALGTAGLTVSSGAFLMDAGVDIQNSITVTGTGSGATIAHDVIAGNALANTINVTSSISGTNLTAMILSGTASASGRIIAEFGTTSTGTNDATRISDVLTLSGVPVVSGSATDIFTLQLTATSVGGIASPWTPYIAWLDGNNAWVNAVTGNTGGTVNFILGAWNASYGLGTYGLDSINNTVWAVLNHNSEFAIVPEPATFALVTLGLGSLVAIRRRRKP